NLTGTFLCSRQALKIMRPQRGGAIIKIFLPPGKKGEGLPGAFFAGQICVGGITQKFGLGDAADKNKMKCFCPPGGGATAAIKNIAGNRGIRMLSPVIVRACAVYLASDESSGITGHSFVATDWNQEHGLEVPYTTA